MKNEKRLTVLGVISQQQLALFIKHVNIPEVQTHSDVSAAASVKTPDGTEGDTTAVRTKHITD